MKYMHSDSFRFVYYLMFCASVWVPINYRESEKAIETPGAGVGNCYVDAKNRTRVLCRNKKWS